VIVTRELGFISYHLIRLVHGSKELDKLANEKPKEFP
jgi:hypothetical protein